MHFANPYVALTDSTPVTIKKGNAAIGSTAPVVGDVLTAGMVHTVEPGIYREGSYGVRIEDTVVVTDAGCERLTPSGKELRIVG